MDIEQKYNNLTDKEKRILSYAYSAIYFNDNSEYYTALYEVIREVIGDVYPDDYKLFKLFCGGE